MDTTSDTSSVFTLTDSLAEQLFRHVPGSDKKYQALNDHFLWPFDEGTRRLEQLLFEWQGAMTGELWWEPPARQGELVKLLNEAGKEGRVLDVGCGVLGLWPSAMAVSFPLCECFGIDLAPSEADYVPPNVSLEVWDAIQGLPFRDNYFDAIRIGAMTAFIPDYSALVSEALRCLKPNGILIITEAECVLHNDQTSIDWLSPRRSIPCSVPATTRNLYPSLKDIVVNSRTQEIHFEDGSGNAVPIPETMFREIFEHEMTIAVGAWEGLTPHEARLGRLKREILLLIWRSRLLDPLANEIKTCEQVGLLESWVANPEERVVTRQKLICARKQG